MQQIQAVRDTLGCGISGATAPALEAYERALAAFQSWRSGIAPQLAVALQEAPQFVMAHVLQAYLVLCSRDRKRVQSARPVLERTAGLATNERERMHLAAIAAILADDYELAKSWLGKLLHRQPRDVLALQVAHSFDHITGDLDGLQQRVAVVLPAWSVELPGYHAVLAMHAFALTERGEYALAERTALAALALNASDARAHHVMAHVFEMTGRARVGLEWMTTHTACWSTDTVVARHCWWHLALFHLELEQPDQALALYDRHIRAGRLDDIADLIDAASLLWRIQLDGGEPGARWAELAAAWAPHVDDRFCSFNDIHAMLAFVGARDWEQAQRLELALLESHAQPTRHGATTRQLGLSACRALIAFGKGNGTLAITLLASLPELAHRLGGSHAQRDVLLLTLLHAIDGGRRPSRPRSMALLAV